MAKNEENPTITLYGIILVKSIPTQESLDVAAKLISEGKVFDVSFEFEGKNYSMGKMQLLQMEEKASERFGGNFKSFCWYHKKHEKERPGTYVITLNDGKINWKSKRILPLCEDGVINVVETLKPFGIVEIERFA